MEIAERLRQLIHDSDFFSFDNHETIKCTISSGVAVWKNQESIDALLNRADDALYAAKRLGRNRTRAPRFTAPQSMQLRPHVADKLLLSSGSEYERRVSYAFQQTPFERTPLHGLR